MKKKLTRLALIYYGGDYVEAEKFLVLIDLRTGMEYEDKKKPKCFLRISYEESLKRLRKLYDR